MEAALRIDVASLAPPQRRALEEVIGRQLAEHQWLMINVMEGEAEPSAASEQAQTLDDWMHVYDGLTDEEIERVDKIIKERANLTRNVP